MSVEQLHREITSGRSGAASSLGEDLVRHSRTLDDSCNDVLDGMTGVNWPEGLAAMAFLVKSQSLYTSISTASWRMYRLGDALSDVAREYDRVVREADRLLRTWEALTPEQRKNPESEGNWMRELTRVKSNWSTYLSDLAADLLDDDERQEMPDEGGGSSERQSDEEWVVRGAERDFLSHLRNGTRRGPRIPNSYINTGDTYVQQGLAHHRGEYFMTSYGFDSSRQDGSDFEASNLKTSNLTTIDSETGEPTGSVNLAGPRSFPDSQPQHSGGVTVMGGYVYVVSTEYGPEPEVPIDDRTPLPHVYKYKLSDIEDAGPGETVRAEERFAVPASSYISNDGENLYLGQFSDDEKNPGRLYTVTPDNRRALEEGQALPLGSRETPIGVNGATVLGDRIIYSQNDGRGNPSTIIEDDLGTGERTEIETGSLVEENTVAGDDLAWLSEAGAEAYSHRDDESAAEDDNDDLWGQSHMTVAPGGAGGVDIEAEPQSLRSASRTFADVSDSVSGVRGDTRGIELPAATLGEVAAASTFSGAVGTQVGKFSDDLGEAETEAETVFSGLRWCADGYELADHESFTGLETFSALLGG